MPDQSILTCDLANISDLEFEERRVNAGLAHSVQFSIPVGPNFDVTSIFEDGCLSSLIAMHGYAAALYKAGDEGLVSVRTSSDDDVIVATAAKNAAAAAKLAERVRDVVPVYEVTDPDLVPVTFWYMGNHAPAFRKRELDSPSWEAICGNYTARTHAGLEQMMTPQFTPGLGGQLLLWNGDAGTGKTTALRTLSREWREWCDFHYIVDPEVFFGPRASYLVNVLLGEEDDLPGVSDQSPHRWRMLILEDCGELLHADAKREVGQGLARLLNACDGLIGRGLRIMVLITTNDPIEKLHPAVNRPGRCALRVEFDSFNRDEAARWLAEHDADAGASGPMTLADLYAQVDGFGHRATPRLVGFA